MNYLKLMRFHKPSGILLLWWPTAWALWIAHRGNPPLSIIFLFLLGTIFMRSAGCVMNDIADRHIDVHVMRTKTRPLAAGEIELIEALILLIVLLFCAFLILIQLPSVCFYYALAAVFITLLYPFCKRFTQGPQFVLGIAFSLGIPMVFATSNDLYNSAMIYLVMINFLWIISYDTQYAMADREDDLRIGVKSTAILFAHHDRFIIGSLQTFFHLLWLIIAYHCDYPATFYTYWVIAAAVLLYQQKLMVKRERADCLRAFQSNSWYGFIMWVGLI